MLNKLSSGLLSALFLWGAPGFARAQPAQNQPQRGAACSPAWAGVVEQPCLGQGPGRGMGPRQKMLNGMGFGQRGQGGNTDFAGAMTRWMHDPQAWVGQFPTYDLGENQRQDMRDQWEQEKLARDVYEVFAQRYGARVFVRLSTAEQRHMDALEALLKKYGEALPSARDAKGVYSKDELTGRYNEALQDGSASLGSAARVGLALEEGDTQALQAAADRAQPDAHSVFEHLLMANAQHERALSRWSDVAAPKGGPVDSSDEPRSKVGLP